MPRRLAAMLVIASALLFTAAPPGAAAGNRPEPTTFVNSLNAPPETVFSDRNLLAWFPIWAEQSLGPKFTLSQPTVLAHVGAFVNAYPPNYSAEGGTPFRIEIRRADANGLPADGEPLAVAVMTDDHDAATWRYESAAFRLLLQSGTYFALVSADIPRDDDHAFPGGVLVGTDEGGVVTYLADTIQLGVRNRLTAAQQLTTGHAPFRVIGCVKTPHPSGKFDHGRACHLHDVSRPHRGATPASKLIDNPLVFTSHISGGGKGGGRNGPEN